MSEETKYQKLKKLAESGDEEAIKKFEEIKMNGKDARNRSYHNSIRLNNGRSYDGRRWNLDYKAIPENKERGKELAKQWYQKNKEYHKMYCSQRRKGFYFNKNIWEKWIAGGSLEDSILLRLNPGDPGLKIQRREYDDL